MKIGLVIPICPKEQVTDYYCEYDNKDRIGIIETLITKESNLDLIVTSNNYLTYNPNCIIKAKEFIESKIVENLNRLINGVKVPIVLGFDLLTDSINFNPYCGIDSIVCYIEVENGQYKYGTHIWECWIEKGNCNSRCFIDQNTNRIFELSGKKIGLLSCGDIAMYCHNDLDNLPEVDIYLNLSHMSVRGHSSQYKVSSKIIQNHKANVVILTQQRKTDITTFNGVIGLDKIVRVDKITHEDEKYKSVIIEI